MVVEIDELKFWKGKEIESTCEIVRRVAGLIKTQDYRDAGYSSLYDMMTRGIGYSEGAAMRRIQAAKVVNERPEALLKLQKGELSLCSLSEIAKAINEETFPVVFSEASGCSKREVERIVSKHLPITKRFKERVRSTLVEAPQTPLFPGQSALSSSKTEVLHTITLQVNDEFMELLNRATSIVGYKPRSEVLKVALTNLVKREERRGTRCSSRKSSPDKRRASEFVRKEVLNRDQHRCQFVSKDGTRCAETHRLEIDHRVPYAKGGKTVPENLRVLCPAHNKLEAERAFGKDKIHRHQQSSQKSKDTVYR